MSTLGELRDRLPDFAKDLRLNLDSITTEAGAPGLNQRQIWMIAHASALAATDATLAEALASEGGLTSEQREGAAAAFAIMSMNNVYYRFTHAVADQAYRDLPARLRMNVMSRPGIERADFELCSMAVSAIQGCSMCMGSHEKVLRNQGFSHEAVQSSVRIGAVIKAMASVLAVL